MENLIERLIGDFCIDFNQSKLELLDNLLFSFLLKKEIILSKGGKKTEIQKILRIIVHYLDYRNIIFKRLAKNDYFEKNFLLKKIYIPVDRIILLITHNCQLRCRYCRVRKFPATMTEEIMFKAIDLLFSSNHQDIQLQFFGGEPLLKFELIKRGVEYAERINKKVKRKLTFILTTNGISLTKEKIIFLKKHNFLIECSADGHPGTQLQQRNSLYGKNYYGKLLNNLKYLFKTGIPHYSISVVMPDNVLSMYDSFRHLVSIGFKRLQINYALGILWPERAIYDFFEQTKKILHFIEKRKGIEFINLTSARREPVVLNAELTVDCDGDIYLETGICLEEDFFAMKKNFFVAKINNTEFINLYTPTLFNNFYRLSEVYGSVNPRFRKIILNNIFLGKRYSEMLKSFIGNKF